MKKRLVLTLGAAVLFAACGIRSPPRPPLPDARPPGDPNMVPTGSTNPNQPASGDTNGLEHQPSFPDGGPKWLNPETPGSVTPPSRTP